MIKAELRGGFLAILVAAVTVVTAGCARQQPTAFKPGKNVYLGEYYDRAKERNRFLLSPLVEGELISPADGEELEGRDLALQEQAIATALSLTPSGIETRWYNIETGNGGWIKPVRTYRQGRRQYCREFVEWVQTDDQREERRAVACRRPKGPWQVEALPHDDGHRTSAASG